jgi:DNA (cytosine-5)-methyltransferase 1
VNQWYEFFAGGGMARLGLGRGWSCLFSNEWSEKKAAAYRARFGPSPQLRVEDVAKLTTADLPCTADLVWASFPCQDLSLAGAGKGLRGERSGTFWPFWRLMEGLIAEARKPGVIVLENVVGTLTSHYGRDFRKIVAALTAHYRVGALVVDAVRFVPQSRPRLFIVALDDAVEPPATLAGAVFNPTWHTKALLDAHDSLARDLRDRWAWWSLPVPTTRVAPFEALIESEPHGVEWHTAETTDHIMSLMAEVHREKVAKISRLPGRHVGAVYRRTRPDERGKKVQRAEVRFDGVSGCLRTPVGGSSRQIILIVEGKRVRSRLLSPREAARLMGVPDDYPIPSAYNEAYHLFGDGLVVPAVAWLERHLLRPLVVARKLIAAA